MTGVCKQAAAGYNMGQFEWTKDVFITQNNKQRCVLGALGWVLAPGYGVDKCWEMRSVLKESFSARRAQIALACAINAKHPELSDEIDAMVKRQQYYLHNPEDIAYLRNWCTIIVWNNSRLNVTEITDMLSSIDA